MNTHLKKSTISVICAGIVAITGCTSAMANDDTAARIAELNLRSAELDAREAKLDARANNAAGLSQDDLLPPGATPGECYARVWVEPEYNLSSEQIQVSQESTKIDVIPARYETVGETIEIKAASTRLETIPAIYTTKSETIKTHEGQKSWRIDLGLKSAPASSGLLAAAKDHGINLESATPGMCFHEHYVPATYTTVSERVLKKAATEAVAISEAQYQMVDKTVLIKEESTRLIEVAAKYRTVKEQIIDKPAHTIWKKGSGPIQKIDEATGEIMCLVEVPATYKTVSRTELASPARTESVIVPAVYDTIQVRQLVSAAAEQRTPVEAVYGSVERQVIENPESFVWHEVSNNEHPTATRTGNKICLTESQPKYKTVTSTVVDTPAQTRSFEVPAQFKEVRVTKLVTPASENVTVIPARFETIQKRALVKDGYMAWRSILCETNMTRSRVADIQRALINAGHEIGIAGADGIIGSTTIRAMNAFQRANDLPVDRYLNIETVKALGVSVK